MSRRACRAAAPQQAVAGWAAGSCRARTSSGRASVSGSDSAGVVPRRAAVPCRRTTVSSVGSGRPSAAPAAAGSVVRAPSSGAAPVTGPLSGSQKAIRPSRGRGAGRKTAASRAGTEGTAPCPARSAVATGPVVSLIRCVTSRPHLGSTVFDSTGGV
ncbi:hypothetical protein SHO565_49380 [Streptomyces sp. HO565]